MSELLLQNPNELRAYWYLLVFLIIPVFVLGYFWYVRTENITYHVSFRVSVWLAKASTISFTFLAGLVIAYLLLASGYGLFSLGEFLLHKSIEDEGKKQDMVIESVLSQIKSVPLQIEQVTRLMKGDSVLFCYKCGKRLSDEITWQFTAILNQFFRNIEELKKREANSKSIEKPMQSKIGDVFGTKTFLFLWLVSCLIYLETGVPIIIRNRVVSYPIYGLVHTVTAFIIASGTTVLLNLEHFPSTWFFAIFVIIAFLIRTFIWQKEI